MSDEALLKDRDSASSKRWSQVRVGVCFFFLARSSRARVRVSNGDAVFYGLDAQTRPYLHKHALSQGGEVKSGCRE